jgi:hypothetical protein
VDLSVVTQHIPAEGQGLARCWRFADRRQGVPARQLRSWQREAGAHSWVKTWDISFLTFKSVTEKNVNAHCRAGREILL